VRRLPVDPFKAIYISINQRVALQYQSRRTSNPCDESSNYHLLLPQKPQKYAKSAKDDFSRKTGNTQRKAGATNNTKYAKVEGGRSLFGQE
jgi:hypothetical protein